MGRRQADKLAVCGWRSDEGSQGFPLSKHDADWIEYKREVLYVRCRAENQTTLDKANMQTYETAENRFIETGGIRYAYRRFGASTGIPLVLIIHFRGTMDHWNPSLINPIAKTRPIILIDNSGIGRSGGEVASTMKQMARNIIDVLQALEIHKIDLLGFSIGGLQAQMLTLNAPDLVRRLILAGTGPSIGPGRTRGPPEVFELLSTAETEEENFNAFIKTFYRLHERGEAAGKQNLKEMNGARSDRSRYLDLKGTERQIAAILAFYDPAQSADASYDRLGEIRVPVLVANGSDDALIPTPNSFLLYEKLVNSRGKELRIFPDSGHGFLNEYAGDFASLIIRFLDIDDLPPLKLHKL